MVKDNTDLLLTGRGGPIEMSIVKIDENTGLAAAPDTATKIALPICGAFGLPQLATPPDDVSLTAANPAYSSLPKAYCTVFKYLCTDIVLNQGPCGMCYIISTVSAASDKYTICNAYKKTPLGNPLYVLQNTFGKKLSSFIDKSSPLYGQIINDQLTGGGCNGGSTTVVLYFMKNVGLLPDFDLAYSNFMLTAGCGVDAKKSCIKSCAKISEKHTASGGETASGCYNDSLTKRSKNLTQLFSEQKKTKKTDLIYVSNIKQLISPSFTTYKNNPKKSDAKYIINKMKNAIRDNGPLSVVYIVKNDFIKYSTYKDLRSNPWKSTNNVYINQPGDSLYSGLIDLSSNEHLDKSQADAPVGGHAVIAVGWCDIFIEKLGHSVGAWIIRNTWGSDWGIQIDPSKWLYTPSEYKNLKSKRGYFYVAMVGGGPGKGEGDKSYFPLWGKDANKTIGLDLPTYIENGNKYFGNPLDFQVTDCNTAVRVPPWAIKGPNRLKYSTNVSCNIDVNDSGVVESTHGSGTPSGTPTPHHNLLGASHTTPTPPGLSYTPTLRGLSYTPTPRGLLYTPIPRGLLYTPTPRGLLYTPPSPQLHAQPPSYKTDTFAGSMPKITFTYTCGCDKKIGDSTIGGALISGKNATLDCQCSPDPIGSTPPNPSPNPSPHPKASIYTLSAQAKIDNWLQDLMKEGVRIYGTQNCGMTESLLIALGHSEWQDTPPLTGSFKGFYISAGSSPQNAQIPKNTPRLFKALTAGISPGENIQVKWPVFLNLNTNQHTKQHASLTTEQVKRLATSSYYSGPKLLGAARHPPLVTSLFNALENSKGASVSESTSSVSMEYFIQTKKKKLTPSEISGIIIGSIFGILILGWLILFIISHIKSKLKRKKRK